MRRLIYALLIFQTFTLSLLNYVEGEKNVTEFGQLNPESEHADPVSAAKTPCFVPHGFVQEIETEISKLTFPETSSSSPCNTSDYNATHGCEDYFKFTQCATLIINRCLIESFVGGTLAQNLNALLDTHKRLSAGFYKPQEDLYWRVLNTEWAKDVSILDQGFEALKILLFLAVQRVTFEAMEATVNSIRDGDTDKAIEHFKIMHEYTRVSGRRSPIPQELPELRDIIGVIFQKQGELDTVENLQAFFRKLPICLDITEAYPNLLRFMWEHVKAASSHLTQLAESIRDSPCNLTDAKEELQAKYLYPLIGNGEVASLTAFMESNKTNGRHAWNLLIGKAYDNSALPNWTPGPYPEFNDMSANTLLTSIKRLPRKIDQAHAYLALFNEMMKTDGFSAAGILILTYRANHLVNDTSSLPLDVMEDLKSVANSCPAGIKAILFGHQPVRIRNKKTGLHLGVISNSVTSNERRPTTCSGEQKNFYDRWSIELFEDGEYFTLKNMHFQSRLKSTETWPAYVSMDMENSFRHRWKIIPVLNGTYFEFKNNQNFRVLQNVGTWRTTRNSDCVVVNGYVYRDNSDGRGYWEIY